MPDTQTQTETQRPAFDGADLVVSTDDLTKTFADETAVDHINLKIPRGVIFGFIGPSGCGKTTTVRMLLGIYNPSSGSARVLDSDPQTFSRNEQEKIGYMPQRFVLNPELSVMENLNFAASLYGVPWRRKKRLSALLELVALDGHEHKKVANISGGMRRRLSMITALAHEPELIFLDEPTAGIDPVLRRTFWDYFIDLKDQNRTLFVTTQYVGEAAYCDYVGVMLKGRLLAVDTPTRLRRSAIGGDIIRLETETFMPPGMLERLETQTAVSIVRVSRQKDNILHIIVDDASANMAPLLEWVKEQGITVKTINEYVPPFDDVFVKLVEKADSQ